MAPYNIGSDENSVWLLLNVSLYSNLGRKPLFVTTNKSPTGRNSLSRPLRHCGALQASAVTYITCELSATEA